jgi:hypothetical protein
MAPTKEDLHDKAVAGEEITQQVVDELRQEETPEGAQQPPRGSTAGMPSLGFVVVLSRG